MHPHKLHYDEVLNQLQVDPEMGLGPEESLDRLDKYGSNKLPEARKKSIWLLFIEQFKNIMIIILILAAGISFAIAWYEKEGFLEPILIIVIVVLNAVIGVVQEGKAEKSLEALKELSTPQARVIRGGKEMMTAAAQLVPGDIVILEAGDYVPADGRLIIAHSLKAEESALTGESVPAEKDALAVSAPDASLGDRVNMVYSGTSITYGSARAVVTATGMDTEMGRIAGLLREAGEVDTPLQLKLAQMGKYIGLGVLLISAVIFIIGALNGMVLIDIFMIAVALAVSAIPEGLPAIVTVVLAIGVQRMVRKKAIIRKLPAVETLGSASVICTDKTGTLTLNQMTLVKAFVSETSILEDITKDNSPAVKKLLQFATLCSDGSVAIEDGVEKHFGDPTETSIVMAAHKNGLPQDELNRLYPRLAVLPFDSDRKLMSTINEIEGRKIVIVKGAFDVLADRCSSGDLETGRRQTEELSCQALRVLAVGYKTIENMPAELTSAALENDLTLMGLVGMMDPPRPEAREAVSICRQAGIKPVMITGDHLVTASAIAEDLGILQPGDEAITGNELAITSEEDLAGRVGNISVYARVTPQDKIRIVRAWQKQGAVVSMTGDGVNDAPALKAADIGCAMGITGTDVAKGAADMILTDDNFATIVDAIKEGRGIYDNIRHTIGFLLGTNIGEVMVVFAAMLLWQVTPLLAVQLLLINLVTDSLPAVALGLEPLDKNVMQRHPQPKGEGIFAHGFGLRIILQGIMFAFLTLIGFTLVWESTGDISAARTMAFIILAGSQVFHAFNMRSAHSLFKIGFFSNKYLNAAAFISLLLILLVSFVPPAASSLGMTHLSTEMYGLALFLALVPVIVLEITKAMGLVKAHQ